MNSFLSFNQFPLQDSHYRQILISRLEQLRQEVRAECDWVWELSLDLVAHWQTINAGFCEDCQAVMKSDRYRFRQLLSSLLFAELDLTGLNEALDELDDQIRSYQRIVKALLEESTID